MDRRQFLAGAASLGISGIWASRSAAAPSRIAWREDRALYPQGVASGDPDEHSVILWTRRPFDQGERHEEEEAHLKAGLQLRKHIGWNCNFQVQAGGLRWCGGV